MRLFALQYLPGVLGTWALVLGVFAWGQWRRKVALRNLSANQPGGCKLQSNASLRRRRVLAGAMLSALVLLLFTILRPIGGMLLSDHKLPAKNVIVLMDVSKSMGVVGEDGFSRMETAKLFAREFVNRRPADRIGLISFAGAAFSECPTTLDRTLLQQRIDVQEPGALPAGGTDLAAALNEAVALLTETPPPGSAIVLLSDGDNITGNPLEDAVTLAERNIPVFAIGFGNPAVEGALPDSKLESRPDFDILREIAELTGAQLFAGEPTRLEQTLSSLSTQLDAVKFQGTNITQEFFSRPLELYAYPLSIVVLLLFLRLFLPARTRRWHPLVGALMLCVCPTDSSLAVEEDAALPPSAILAAALEEARELDKPLLLIFTGSDWSKSSIAFEEEILAHARYQVWAARSVVEVRIDLPHANIDSELRKQRRQLAFQFSVERFPTALFLDADENELGRLTHDSNGPAAWIRRAESILAGNASESDAIASMDNLPESVRERLEDPDATAAERSIRCYNHAVTLEQQLHGAAAQSRDHSQLLEELHTTARFEAPEDRPDLAFAPTYKLALLKQLQGRVYLQQKPKKALVLFSAAYEYYRDAAALNPAHPELPGNLTLLENDRRNAQRIIDFQDAYKAAVEITSAAYQQENRFRRSLDQWVTTTRPINDGAISNATAAIVHLVDTATAIEFPGLDAITNAYEDIVLAPDPHATRGLQASTQHIKDALDHLLQNVQQQPQSGEGDEDDENSEGDGSGGNPNEGNDDAPFGDHDADLMQAEGQGGDLRGRLLKKLGDKAKPVPPGRDR